MLREAVCALALLGLLEVVHSVSPIDGDEQEPPDFAHPMWKLHYVIMIDAGSTGSRLHVHPYRKTKGLPVIQSSNNLKLKPGLSSYENNPDDAGTSLVGLLDFAKQQIPMAQWHSTPVFLKATAGLRSIPPEAAQKVLDACRRVIESYPFLFQPHWAEIISGREEGMYGWIAANYLDGTFHRRKSTVGVVEVGGASMQVTFVPQDVKAASGNLMSVELGDQNYKVYTHSYLHYGLEAAMKLFLKRNEALLKSEGNPCAQPKCPVNPQFSGTGQWGKCYAMMDSLFNASAACASSCSFNGVVQPSVTTERFYAIENFFYTTDFFGLAHGVAKPFSQLQKKGKEFCALPWAKLKSSFAKERAADLQKYCFSSAYLLKVLSLTLGLDPSGRGKLNEQQIRIVRNLNGVGIDWALGAVLRAVASNDFVAMAKSSTDSAAPGVYQAQPCSDSSASSLLLGICVTALVVVVCFLLKASAGDGGSGLEAVRDHLAQTKNFGTRHSPLATMLGRESKTNQH